MSCTTIESIDQSLDCTNPIGGIKRIHINDQSNVVTTTADTSTWIATLSASTSFETVEFRKNLGTYTESYTKADDGSIMYVQEIVIPIHGRNAAASRKVNILAEGQRELALIVEMNSGLFVYFDYAQLNSVADGSSAAKIEASKYTLTFGAESEHLAYFMTAANVATLI